MTEIAIATGNRKKFDFIQARIARPENVAFVQVAADIKEIQAPTLVDVCKQKALDAWAELKRPLLAHDCGMMIDELNGFPGPYTKDMTQVIGVDKLFEMFGNFKKKSFVYQDCLTFIDESGNIHQFVSDTGDVFLFSSRKGETVHADMPLNTIVALCDKPDVPQSEREDWVERCMELSAEKNLPNCWNDFSAFLFERYSDVKDVA